MPLPSLQHACVSGQLSSFLQLAPATDMLIEVPSNSSGVNAFVNALVVILVFLAPLTQRFQPISDSVMGPLFLTLVMGGL